MSTTPNEPTQPIPSAEPVAAAGLVPVVAAAADNPVPSIEATPPEPRASGTEPVSTSGAAIDGAQDAESEAGTASAPRKRRRGPKELREAREARAQNAPREPKEAQEPSGVHEAHESHEAREPREPREPRGTRPAAPEVLRFEDVISGEFDAEQEQPELPGKRVLAPQVESPKLHKVLAQAGLGSRLEMEQLILEGRISVNGEPAHIGQRIQFGDVIKVNGKPIRVRMTPQPPRVLAYHKPAGEVVTHDDPQTRPTV